MEIRVQEAENLISEQKEALLLSRDDGVGKQTLVQRAIRQTFESTAHLANLLPTGTVLAFQLLSPIVTNQGACDMVSRAMTKALVALCGLSSFLLCFTDSFRDEAGNVTYGFATMHGLWVIDGSTRLPPELAERCALLNHIIACD